MSPENVNSNKPHEYKKSFELNESILLNNRYGIFVERKHNTVHVSVLDGKSMRRKTNHLEPGASNQLALEDLIISSKQNAKDETEIKIESENQIQIVTYNYIQDFYKLFGDRIKKRDELVRLSTNIARIVEIREN